MVPMTLQGVRVRLAALLDTGSNVSLLPVAAVDDLAIPFSDDGRGKVLSGFGGSNRASGSAVLRVTLGTYTRPVRFLVAPSASLIILGLEDLSAFGISLNCLNYEVKLKNGEALETAGGRQH